jgi:hypothetical protein
MVYPILVYTCSTPFQETFVIGFETALTRLGSPKRKFNSIFEELIGKRDFMVTFLVVLGGFELKSIIIGEIQPYFGEKFDQICSNASFIALKLSIISK